MYKWNIMWYNIKKWADFRKISSAVWKAWGFMKKAVSLILLCAMLVLLTCCSGGTTPVETFLLAVKKMDTVKMEELMTSDSASMAARIKEYADSLDSEKCAVLISLYSELKYAILEESEVENETKTVLVALTIPDIAAVKSFAEAKTAVSGESAYEIVGTMLSDGAVSSSYMTEKKIAVAIKLENEKWLIPYSESENGELIAALSLVEMLRFFALG